MTENHQIKGIRGNKQVRGDKMVHGMGVYRKWELLTDKFNNIL
jgi:hypothetical protein